MPSLFLFLSSHSAIVWPGRKRKKSKTSNYIVSCDPTDLSRNADGFCGKLRSNVFGTSFTVFDNGNKECTESPRLDLAVIIYVSLEGSITGVYLYICLCLCLFYGRTPIYWASRDPAT